jgi:YVTN family beta-propeller protein
VNFDAPGDRAFVSSENGGTLSILDLRADSVLGVVHIADGTTKPTGIALSPDGKRVYVANGAGNRVTVIDPAAARVVSSIEVGTRPWGVALSPDGGPLYPAEGRSNKIWVIDTLCGRVRATAAVGERPYSLVIVPVRDVH